MNLLSRKLVIGLSIGEDFVILACVVFTQCQRVTDGQTDIPIVASTGLSATLTPCKNWLHFGNICIHISEYVYPLFTAVKVPYTYAITGHVLQWKCYHWKSQYHINVVTSMQSLSIFQLNELLLLTWFLQNILNCFPWLSTVYSTFVW